MLWKLPVLPVLAVAMTVTLIGVSALTHAQAGTPRGNELHGKRLAEAYCAACHGSDGNSTDPSIPKLAGQDPAYLLAQLRAFKSGARQSDIMAGPVSALADAQLRELADYYSHLTAKADATRNKAAANLGAKIFSQPGPGSPPCAACHGGNGFGPMGSMMGRGRGMMGGGGMMGGMGMMGNTGPVPRLNGQHAAYVVRQLDAFASGARYSPAMGRIASSLSAEDRGALAEYVSGLAP